MTGSALQALGVALPVAYLAATLLYGMAFAGATAPPVPAMQRMRGPALALALGAHAAYFALRARAVGGFPLIDTWTLVSAVAFTTAALFAVVTVRSPQPTVACLVLALVSLLQLAASAFGPLGEVAPASAANDLLVLHATTSVLAAAALLLSGVYGALYLVLYREMRAHHFGPLFRELPDLERLTHTTRRAALAGFVCLTVGLNLGIWMAHRDEVAGFDYTDPSVLLTLALWVHFGAIAFSRRIRGLSARRASYAALFGLVALILTLFLTLLPSLTFHSLR